MTQIFYLKYVLLRYKITINSFNLLAKNTTSD
jgi:hypothetical protein